ncbi:dethiobiotin synthetase [Phenylobacterium haematophilum]|jgi:dethiobiotin synthetase|uniref:ATP-dependent dethiobiotin synthetase BioD n=1 Tax=Phenylobacterium haematophilum TaxID=98513 RepID=A0A840A0A7_9CAUL|nr:dethiobiotin synthase [Phenylobacterium haematophilum]MBB3891399.1 dethiobiotin synthetase [Phenylobacterium haematophilum]
MRQLFVTGAHTDVGKTYVACAMLRAARAKGLSVAALKPAVSGIDPADWTDSDPGRLLAAMDRLLTLAELDAIAPLRFAAPLSPPMAARLEGVDLRISALTEFCRAGLAASAADLMLVEGAGGVMSPMAEDGTGLDLMLALGLPSVVVGGSYLGSISHTLTAIETLRSRGLPIAAVVISQSGEPDAPDFAQTVASVAAFAGEVRIVAAARGDEAWASALV